MLINIQEYTISQFQISKLIIIQPYIHTILSITQKQTLFFSLTYIFPPFQMFSRGNIIQKGNQKNIREPYTILPHFSISQRKPFDVPCQNPL